MSGVPAMRGARAAVVVLTRVPVGGFPYHRAEMRWAAAWFPLVGAGIGAVQWVAWMAAGSLGPLAAAAVALAAGVLVTGALHEDGLADTADALGGGPDRQSIFRILKDSPIGTYGATALILSFLLRIGLLTSQGVQVGEALLVAQTVSRVPSAWLMATLPYVTPDVTAKSRDAARTGPLQACVATLLAIGVLGLIPLPGDILPGRWIGLSLALVIVMAGSWLLYRHKAGGVTGDFLGATQQVAEIAALMTLVGGWPE